MSVPSCELKLRMLAQANIALAAALTFTINGSPVFMWMDRQLTQGDIGLKGDNRTAVTVQRVSTAPREQFGNQGGPVQNFSAIRLQINVVDYNAERARQVAQLVTKLMQSVSLMYTGEFASPVTQPNQSPNYLLNERGTMWPQIAPPPYVQIQDWRVFNNEAVPGP